MNQSNEPNVEEIAESIVKSDATRRRALSVLLGEVSNKKDSVFVQSSFMGGSDSYLGTVTFEWLAARVRFANQLPLFREKVDELGNIIVNADTIEDMSQRSVDWSRQAVLAEYLAALPKHKFPPVLVVVTQAWVDNPQSDEWDADGRAVRSAIDFDPIDARAQFGLLDVSEHAHIYALDGQHRLLGIQGLMELSRTGRLQRKNKKGEAIKNSVLTIEELAERGRSSSVIQKLPEETIGVEFISAVNVGETRAEAYNRVRSIFVHVNKNATALTQGQIHMLDEDSGTALVARRIATQHPLFTAGEQRVNMENNTISQRSLTWTTLQALAESSGHLLRHRFGKGQFDKAKKGVTPQRPTDPELKEATDIVNEYFDHYGRLPSIERASKGTSVRQLRNFRDESEGDMVGEANLLFRPVGQTALAAAIGTLVDEGKDLRKIFAKLERFDAEGGFAGIDQPASLWFGVIYDPKRQRMLVAGERLVARLLVYLAGGGIEQDAKREELRSDLADARRFENHFMLFDGTMTEDGSKIKLPSPL